MPDTSPPLPPWLSVKVVAHLISASPSFVRRLIAIGKLPASNISSGTGQRAEWRILRTDLEAFMAAAQMEGARR